LRETRLSTGRKSALQDRQTADFILLLERAYQSSSGHRT
jgi:hypothetical protein